MASLRVYIRLCIGINWLAQPSVLFENQRREHLVVESLVGHFE